MVLLRKRKKALLHTLSDDQNPPRRFTGIMAVCYWDYREERRQRERRERRREERRGEERRGEERMGGRRCMSETVTDYSE